MKLLIAPRLWVPSSHLDDARKVKVPAAESRCRTSAVSTNWSTLIPFTTVTAASDVYAPTSMGVDDKDDEVQRYIAARLALTSQAGPELSGSLRERAVE